MSYYGYTQGGDHDDLNIDRPIEYVIKSSANIEKGQDDKRSSPFIVVLRFLGRSALPHPVPYSNSYGLIKFAY